MYFVVFLYCIFLHWLIVCSDIVIGVRILSPSLLLCTDDCTANNAVQIMHYYETCFGKYKIDEIRITSCLKDA